MADADVLVAHNFYGFALDVLLSRMRALRTADWSRLGRLQRAQLPRPGDTFGARQAVAGRVVCDTYLASRDLVRAHSYSLGSLARQELGIRREDIAPDRVSDHFAAAKPLLHLLRHAAFDAFLATALMVHLHVLPLTLQLTTLAGNLWSRTLMGARAERNEHLLLHEFYRAKFIRPDRRSSRTTASDDDAAPARRKPAYLGGLVLEPQRGFYDRFVLLLDFNSLYPSIIQEFNICFTTVRPGAADAVPEPPEPSEPQGVLPRLLKTLVDRRRQVKQLLAAAAPAEREQLDVRQRALKLTANSMYGCLGFTHSRFYAKPLAMLITARGREILQATRDLALADGLEVIYGDTDSLMIATRATSLADVYALGSRFRRRVNERYRLLELGIDAVFRRLLLLKKKKYAALVISDAGPSAEPKTELETKGLDLVRRDWCGLSHDVSDYVLRLLFAEPDALDSSHSSDHNGLAPDHDQNSALALIHDHLTKVATAVRARQVPLDKYAIHKGLTKPPEAYADKKGQPHVMVALRMRGSGHTVRAGDTVPYVICDAQSPALLRDAADQQLATGSFADRARHPDEVRDSAGQLYPDAEWYLNQQVLPPCARLLEPLQATDMATLAQCLGLDAAKYRAASASAAGNAYSADSLRTLDSQISDSERFRYAQSFVANCPLCDKEYHVDGIARKIGDRFESGLLCSHCNGLPSPGSLATQLAIQIRRHIRQYYEFVLQCDEPDCALQTKLLSVVGTRCSRPGCSGKLQESYSDKALYVQIQYFASLFSLDRSATRLETSASAIIQLRDSHPEHIAKLLTVVESYLAVSARRFVDLSSLFSFCRL
ncbi:DNA-directed DNA polymerase alpha catalytic subunit pol1 [Coemansia sp. RSA 1365]|nr:DNA-directed DNA polymerase alpha catalytic subunit pol1 [Coemansia sp. RSA 1365]